MATASPFTQTTIFQWKARGLVGFFLSTVCFVCFWKADRARAQDVEVLQEASGHDSAFEKKLLEAYLQTCLPHIAAVEAGLSEARRVFCQSFTG